MILPVWVKACPIAATPPEQAAQYLPFQLTRYFPVQLILNRLPPDAKSYFQSTNLTVPGYRAFLKERGITRAELDYPLPVQAVAPFLASPSSAAPLWKPLEVGKAMLRRAGTDLTIATLGVGVHRAGRRFGNALHASTFADSRSTSAQFQSSRADGLGYGQF